MPQEEYTVVGLLIVAIVWLVRKVAVLEKKLEDSHDRESSLRDKRAEELVEHARQMAAGSEIVRDALRKHDNAVAELEESINSLKKIIGRQKDAG